MSSWLVRLLSMSTGAGILAYATGYDRKNFATVTNVFSDVFSYIMLKMMDLFLKLLDKLPDIDLSGYADAVEDFIIVVSRVNRFVPVVELFGAICFFVSFLLVFIVVKFILKIIPTIG